MYKFVKRFARDEDGAITVDWVVLTAGIGFVSVVIVATILQAATDKGKGIGAKAYAVGVEAMEQ